MSGIQLVVSKRNIIGPVHADPGGGLTCCGRLCSGWHQLSSYGSLYDVSCQQCVAVLRKAGDLPRPAARPPRNNDDALSNRAAEPGSAEYAYLHRYDSPDNKRDSMG